MHTSMEAGPMIKGDMKTSTWINAMRITMLILDLLWFFYSTNQWGMWAMPDDIQI